jgi:hypothetical protein
MKILKLEASNIKRVRVVEINPDGSVVLITGRNAQGKSSVLDAIIYALGGKEAIPGKPLRDGTDAGFIRLDLGDIVVERTFTADNTYLKVLAGDTNARYPNPQALLDGLVGKIAFDPLVFARMKAKDQLGALLEVVDLGIDLEKEAAERKGLFDQRTDVNRDIDRLKGALAKTPSFSVLERVDLDDIPDEPISAVDLVAQLEKLSAQAAQAVRDDEEYRKTSKALTAARAEVERLKSECDLLENGSQNRGLWDDEIAALRSQVADAEETNNLVRVKKQRLELEGNLAAAQAASDGLTSLIRMVDNRKAAALAGATFPVDGLSFDEDGVLYDGRPLEQASSSELTRVSTAVAMAANPKLKVIIIKDGSLLDDDNLRVITEIAAGNDYQVWIEKVDDSGAVGVYIEDGCVAREQGVGGGSVPANATSKTAARRDA